MTDSDHIAVWEALARLADQIEAEMRRIGYWSEGGRPVDIRGPLGPTNTFEQWLQYVAIGEFRRRAAQRLPLPHTSQLGLMAMRQYDYHSQVEEAWPLMRLLEQVDRLIADAPVSMREAA